MVGEAGDGEQALEAVERLQPQVVFLDIRMPGLDGLEVARRLGGRTHVVFITAFDRYAVDAFEQGAVDYVLKPIVDSRLQLTIERLRARLSDPPADLDRIAELLHKLAPVERGYLKWLTVPHGKELRVVPVAEIAYLRADTKYTSIFTPYGSFLLNSSLRRLHGRLDPQVFWQVHRSVVVNVGAIETLYRSFRGTMEIKIRGHAELLPVSAAFAHLFREMR